MIKKTRDRQFIMTRSGTPTSCCGSLVIFIHFNMQKVQAKLRCWCFTVSRFHITCIVGRFLFFFCRRVCAPPCLTRPTTTTPLSFLTRSCVSKTSSPMGRRSSTLACPGTGWVCGWRRRGIGYAFASTWTGPSFCFRLCSLRELQLLELS